MNNSIQALALPLQIRYTAPQKPAGPVNLNLPQDSAEVLDLVSIKGRPLDAGGYARQVSASASYTAQATSAGAAGLPALVSTYFSPSEWAQLNPGRYHDENHPVHVANGVADVAANLGRPAERVQFLQQVALLHDVDERVNLKTGEQNAVTPARVPVTLEWMDRNESALSQRMGWNGTDFVEAKALIARTDFPFNEAPKNLGTRYDGVAPVQLYADLVKQLPAERRQAVAEDALLLRFADQTANYTGSREQSMGYIKGLAEEFNGVGIKTTFEELAKGSPAFLATAGTDLQEDWKIAGALNLDSSRFANRENLLDALPSARRQALESLR